MKKLIYLDDAIEKMKALFAEDVERYGVEIPECFPSDRAIEALRELPTQPEIIRCKDCRFARWYVMFDGVKGCVCNKNGAVGYTETDFCSYAERKEDGTVTRPDIG